MRNAGDAPKYCTTLVLIPVLKAGGGTNFGNQLTFPPAFLFSLVFLVRLTFSKTIGAYKRTENSTASPRGKQCLKLNASAYTLNIPFLPHKNRTPWGAVSFFYLVPVTLDGDVFTFQRPHMIVSACACGGVYTAHKAQLAIGADEGLGCLQVFIGQSIVDELLNFFR